MAFRVLQNPWCINSFMFPSYSEAGLRSSRWVVWLLFPALVRLSVHRYFPPFQVFSCVLESLMRIYCDWSSRNQNSRVLVFIKDNTLWPAMHTASCVKTELRAWLHISHTNKQLIVLVFYTYLIFESWLFFWLDF